MNSRQSSEQVPDTICVITTFLSKNGKYDQVSKALETLLPELGDRVGRILLLNEYSEKDTTDLLYNIKKKHPRIEIMNKKKDQRGQAKSLNIILDILDKNPKMKYWIHWEESWELKGRGCIESSLDIMDRDNIDQLQLNTAWDGNSNKKHDKYYEIFYKDDKHELQSDWNECSNERGDCKWSVESWPLFSLQPSVNKVSSMLSVGVFDENPDKWPVSFEYEFASKWYNKGFKKAVLLKPCAFRQDGHVSTYT